MTILLSSTKNMRCYSEEATYYEPNEEEELSELDFKRGQADQRNIDPKKG